MSNFKGLDGIKGAGDVFSVFGRIALRTGKDPAGPLDTFLVEAKTIWKCLINSSEITVLPVIASLTLFETPWLGDRLRYRFVPFA